MTRILNLLHRPWLPAGLAVMTALLMITGCGGGGGGGGSSTPPPADSASSPTSPKPWAPTGALWHSNYALDFLEGTQISPLDGRPSTLASASEWAVPWRDGSRYAYTDWDTANDTTQLSVFDTGVAQPVLQGSIAGYLRGGRPSPADRNLMLAFLGDDMLAPADVVFIDITQSAIIGRAADEGGPIDWLPDGRYLRMRADGTLLTGSIGGTESASGAVVLPPNHVANAMRVDPQGKRLALVLANTASAGTDVDVWVADVDGSHLEQFTKTGMSASIHWSPDSNAIAFDVDTGLLCSGYYCAGSCGLWWAPATSREVIAVPSSHDAYEFTVHDRDGDETTLGCDLLGWTTS